MRVYGIIGEALVVRSQWGCVELYLNRHNEGSVQEEHPCHRHHACQSAREGEVRPDVPPEFTISRVKKPD